MAPKQSKLMTRKELDQEDKVNNFKKMVAKRIKRKYGSKSILEDSDGSSDDKENTVAGYIAGWKSQIPLTQPSQQSEDDDSSIEFVKTTYTQKTVTVKKEKEKDEQAAYAAACAQLEEKKRKSSENYKMSAKKPKAAEPEPVGSYIEYDDVVWDPKLVDDMAKGKKMDKKYLDYEACFADANKTLGEIDGNSVSSEEEGIGDFVPSRGLKAFKKSVMGEESSPSPSPPPTACRWCEMDPCVVEHCEQERFYLVETAMAEGKSPNEIRYGLYKMHAYALGYKARTPLPRCVLNFITANFPAPDNLYTGFKPKEEII